VREFLARVEYVEKVMVDRPFAGDIALAILIAIPTAMLVRPTALAPSATHAPVSVVQADIAQNHAPNQRIGLLG
jgi:hypothetical protein